MLKKPLPDLSVYQFREVAFKQLMQNRVYNILIVCSNYDYYTLEEDGRIDELIYKEYTELSLRYPPNFIHAHSAKKAISILKSDRIELVITWLHLDDSSFATAKKIKKKYPDIPIAALSYSSVELKEKITTQGAGIIDGIFKWNGNVDIIVAIIKLTEDRMNADRDIKNIGVKAILLVEDSIRFYSRYLPLLYKIILRQTFNFMFEGLNEHRRMILKRGRPKILMATTYEEAVVLYDEYKDQMLGVISDVRYYKEGKKDAKAGFRLYEYIRSKDKDIPFLIQSLEEKNEVIAREMGCHFLYKESDILGVEIKNFIVQHLSFGSFKFYSPSEGKVITEAHDLKQLQETLVWVPLDSISYHAKRNDFSKWLHSRALFPLANLFEQVEYEHFTEEDAVRDFLIDAVKKFRFSRSRGVIAHFEKDKYDDSFVYSRIGNGALGGKARGLAFIDSFLKRHKLLNKYEGVSISIPRTVVLSTDVFDEFMESYDLFEFISNTYDDQEILIKFTSLPLPEWALEDIRAFLMTLRSPIAVRSSSVLEDSLHQPFAGVFSTYMVPMGHINKMLEMVSNAIKSVYASAFFEKSREYVKLTANSLEEDKMAVVLQELIGAQYEDVYYPTFSGVARSINFYPLGEEKSDQGIAHVALGLGMYIVGGGKALRFSPYYPKKILQLSNAQTALKETQKYFYALKVDPESYQPSLSEQVNIERIRISKAKHHDSLKHLASTYEYQNDMLRPGMFHEGAPVITFDQILKYESFPLAEILKDLLKIGQREMQNPVEIEFAVNLDVPEGHVKEFSFLQIRPIMAYNDFKDYLPENINNDQLILSSNSSLGNGKYKNLRDVIYVKPDVFDPANTRAIAEVIAKLNKKMEKKKRHYILIGPGRWGSSDPWLGIPINWAQISYTKIIVESGLDTFRVEPSQGTHFFQNLTAFKVGYLTINPFSNDGYYDVAYLDQQEAVYEDEYLRHVRFATPLNVILEGKSKRAIIMKEGEELPDVDDVEISFTLE